MSIKPNSARGWGRVFLLTRWPPALDAGQPLLTLCCGPLQGDVETWWRQNFQILAEMPQLFLQEAAELYLNLESDKRTWTGTQTFPRYAALGFIVLLTPDVFGNRLPWVSFNNFRLEDFTVAKYKFQMDPMIHYTRLLQVILVILQTMMRHAMILTLTLTCLLYVSIQVVHHSLNNMQLSHFSVYSDHTLSLH